MAAKTRFFLAALVVTLGLDQLTKYRVITDLYYGERVDVISGLFELTHVRNPGGAFSFFANGGVTERMFFFIGMTLVAVALLLVFFRQLEPEVRLVAASLGGILGGALGNLTDRVVHGEVIDFLNFHIGSHYWPTFNLADSFIVTGVGILLLEMFFEPGDEKEPVVASEPPAS
jgi:signal peptidase II